MWRYHKQWIVMPLEVSVGLLVTTAVLFAQEVLPPRSSDLQSFSTIANAGIYAVIALIVKSIAEPVLTAFQNHRESIKQNIVGKVQEDLFKALANCQMKDEDIKELKDKIEEIRSQLREERLKAETYFNKYQDARVYIAQLTGGKDPPSEMGSQILYGNRPDRPK